MGETALKKRRITKEQLRIDDECGHQGTIVKDAEGWCCTISVSVF